jgi:putative methyltransferase
MLRNLYLFQPQYSVEYRSEKNHWLPYSAGCLWSYAQQFTDITDHWQCKEIFFKRDPHETVLKSLHSPKLCAFSCYQWNKTYCVKLAKKIKQQWPDCCIVFGGPEVNVLFFEHDFVDTIVLGEGEISFVDILKDVTAGKKLQQVYDKKRIGDLSQLPSPYSTGVFDQLIQNNPGVKWATTLETNRGCPFSCTFCDWGSVTYSKVKQFPMSRVKEDLDWISKNPICYIFCADANFGIFKERDLEISKLIRKAGDLNKTLESFNATFNKNNNEWSFKILDVLGSLNRGFTVSVQSMNPDTLEVINRSNLGINDLSKIFLQCEQHQINSYTELILGLPLETKQSFIQGLCQLLELGQHNHIEIWFTDLLANSALAGPSDTFKYNIKTVSTGKYLTLSTDKDPYDEIINLISSTNTMSTVDMIDSFMFGWLIVNFHMQGYTQLVSKYLRLQHNISYNDFYHTCQTEIYHCEVLKKIYNQVRSNIEDLLYHGKLPQGLSGHNLVFCEGHSLYQARNSVFDLIRRVCKTMIYNSDIDSILALQTSWIFDVGQQYPLKISSDYDIFLNQPNTTHYVVNSKIKFNEFENFDNLYYVLRRKGALKNSLEKVI